MLATGRDTFRRGGGITLNSFCFGLYIKDVFLGLAVYIRARTYYAVS